MADWEHVLDALVRERGAALVRYAALLTGGTSEAEDLVQEALVRAFSQGRPLREAHAAEAYVRRAILTVFLDGYRRRARWSGVRHLLVGAETTDGPEDASTARADVHSALATLRPRLRACVKSWTNAAKVICALALKMAAARAWNMSWIMCLKLKNLMKSSKIKTCKSLSIPKPCYSFSVLSWITKLKC